MSATRALIEASLRALGRADLPERVCVEGGEYTFVETLQHSFFAATGLYNGPAGKAVLKFGRQASLFGFPLAWVGRRMVRHELRMYRAVEDIDGVPACLGPIGEIGFGHRFAEGRSHRRGEPMPVAFFERLQEMIDEVHRRRMAYVDLSKPENILVGDDGEPHLIDFQIAWHWPARREDRRGYQRWIPSFIGDWILRTMQEGDRVHVLKHWRRSAPAGLSEEQLERSIRRTGFIRFHEVFSAPYFWVRRGVRWLWRRFHGA